MNDQQTLLLVLVLLYLSECCVWFRFGSVVIRIGRFGRTSIAHPSTSFGNASGGLVFLNPLPLLESTFVCHAWPLSITPDLVYSDVGQTINPGKRPERLGSYAALDDFQNVTTAAGTIRIDGANLIDLGTSAAAERFGAVLKTLSTFSRAEREAVLDVELGESMSVERVRSLLDRFYRESWMLRFLCLILFILLIILLPLSVVAQQFSRWAPGVFTSAAICWLGILICFERVHRLFFPANRNARMKALAKMLVLPTAAIRAGDLLSRDLLVQFDPLAVAAAVCDRNRFTMFARSVIRDLRFPIHPVCPSPSLDAKQAEASFRHRLEDHCHRLLRRRGVVVGELLTQPTPIDHLHLAYCPRCEAQFVIAEGCCRDCGGRPS